MPAVLFKKHFIQGEANGKGTVGITWFVDQITGKEATYHLNVSIAVDA